MAKDLRFRKNEEEIQRAFVELLKEKPFEKITVQNVADRARIAKGTFYLHYQDKYQFAEKQFAVFQKHLQELIDAYIPYRDRAAASMDARYNQASIDYVIECMPFLTSLETGKLNYSRVVRTVYEEANYESFLSRGYPEEQARLMSWQAACIVWMYCSYLVESPAPVSMEEFFASQQTLNTLISHIYNRE